MGGGMMKDVITPPHTQHLYPYRWSLEDAVFTKDKGKVLLWQRPIRNKLENEAFLINNIYMRTK